MKLSTNEKSEPSESSLWQTVKTGLMLAWKHGGPCARDIGLRKFRKLYGRKAIEVKSRAEAVTNLELLPLKQKRQVLEVIIISINE